MKKLLALVLCVMMLASISVSAFAKVDLSVAYEKYNELYNTLGVYGTKTTINNLYKGFKTAFPKLPANAFANLQQVFNDVNVNNWGTRNVLGDIYVAYETAGQYFVDNNGNPAAGDGSVAGAIMKVTDGITMPTWGK